ncbi:MAG: CDP-diacylglycerol--glycerol-3-phosphate 3-phosphatidyltransferase [Ignavibacteriales bacterium]|nr:CDP-diacylglycerol--glycerol-3-phosphate 3-phosphatidyltransferase [Ignavibacteriales bacterium]
MTRKIWTVSNLLSISRILFVLPAAYLIFADAKSFNWEIVSLILIAAITDYLDGFFARRFNQVTELGKILDPVADKVAIAILSVALVLSGRLSIWFCAIVILRDIAIMLGSVRIMKIKKITIQSNWIGKWTVTVIALYLLSTIIFVDNMYGVLSALQVISLVMIIISFISYLTRYLSEVRSIQK